MTKQEKTKVTKKAKSIFNHFLFFTKNRDVALTCSLISVNELILNSEGEKMKFWQCVKMRILEYAIINNEKEI